MLPCLATDFIACAEGTASTLIAVNLQWEFNKLNITIRQSRFHINIAIKTPQKNTVAMLFIRDISRARNATIAQTTNGPQRPRLGTGHILLAE